MEKPEPTCLSITLIQRSQPLGNSLVEWNLRRHVAVNTLQQATSVLAQTLVSLIGRTVHVQLDDDGRQ